MRFNVLQETILIYLFERASFFNLGYASHFLDEFIRHSYSHFNGYAIHEVLRSDRWLCHPRAI
eukprot:SAG11_NODE_5_length_32399_cov_6.724118_26_plen_63_part_00